MALTKMVNGVVVELTPEEEAAVMTEWAASEQAEESQNIKDTDFQAQIDSEKADLPTWDQMVVAIDKAFTDNLQANIIKKIARPIYTYLKKTID